MPKELEFVDLKQAFESDYLTLTSDWGDDTVGKNLGPRLEFIASKLLGARESQDMVQDLFKCLDNEESIICSGIMKFDI